MSFTVLCSIYPFSANPQKQALKKKKLQTHIEFWDLRNWPKSRTCLFFSVISNIREHFFFSDTTAAAAWILLQLAHFKC